MITKEQHAYIILGHIVGPDKIQVTLDALANLDDNLQRFALLLGLKCDPARAKSTLKALGYQP